MTAQHQTVWLCFYERITSNKWFLSYVFNFIQKYLFVLNWCQSRFINKLEFHFMIVTFSKAFFLTKLFDKLVNIYIWKTFDSGLTFGTIMCFNYKFKKLFRWFQKLKFTVIELLEILFLKFKLIIEYWIFNRLCSKYIHFII